MRVLLIGPGSLARRVYLPLLTAHPDVELDLIAGRSEQRARQAAESYRVARWSVEPVTQAAAAWRKEGFAAAFVHVSTEQHAAVVLPLLEAGIPVYVDKPLAYSLEEARAMATLAREKNVPLLVGFNRRYAPQVLAAREAVPRPALAAFAKHRSARGPYAPRETIFDDFIHPLDLAVSVGAERLEWVGGERTSEGDLRWLKVILRLPGGVATVSMVRGTGTDVERIELVGAGAAGAEPGGAEPGGAAGRGLVVLDGLEQRTWAGPDGWCRAESPPWQPIWERRGFTGAVEAFLAAVRDPARPGWREALDLSLRSQKLAAAIVAELGW